MKLALALLASLSPFTVAPQDPPAAAPAPVKVELVCCAEQIGADDEFELAARISLADGVRIGWQNPGDGGEPTTAKLEVPPGFVAAGPVYPAPKTFKLGYGLQGFGYERETALFFRVKAPHSLAQDQRLTFSVDVTWHTSGASDLAGHTKAQTAVACYPLRDAIAPETAAMLARQRALLARPWSKLDKATMTWRVTYNDIGEGLGLELMIDVEGADQLEYFALPVSDLVCGERRVKKLTGAARTVAQYVYFSETKSPPPDARGMLRVERNGVSEYYDVRASRPTPLAFAKR